MSSGQIHVICFISQQRQTNTIHSLKTVAFNLFIYFHYSYSWGKMRNYTALGLFNTKELGLTRHVGLCSQLKICLKVTNVKNKEKEMKTLKKHQRAG